MKQFTPRKGTETKKVHLPRQLPGEAIYTPQGDGNPTSTRPFSAA